MHNELTNLLPEGRQKAVARDYFLRFTVVAVWFVAALAFIGMLLLIPTYILLITNVQAKQNYLNEASAVSSQADSLSSRLAVLNAEAGTLNGLSKAPSASALLRQALAIPRPGVALSDFDYAPASGGKPGSLVITGIAATRDALRTYQLAVQGAPFSKTAALPVSAYAKDTNISFSITVTLAP